MRDDGRNGRVGSLRGAGVLTSREYETKQKVPMDLKRFDTATIDGTQEVYCNDTPSSVPTPKKFTLTALKTWLVGLLDSIYLKLDASNDPITAPLEVQRASSANLLRSVTTNADSISGVQVVNDAQGWALQVRGDASDGLALRDTTNNLNPFFIEPAAPTNSLYIDSAGEVGLGTATPVSDLHIESADTNVQLHLKTTDTGSTATDGFELSVGSANAFVWNYESAFLQFGTNNLARMTIDSDGDVGVGTASPAEKVEINGNLTFTKNAARVISVQTLTSGTNGYSLTVKAGDGASSGNKAGPLVLRGGQPNGVGRTGGDVYVAGGDDSAGGTDGDVYLGYNGSAAVGQTFVKGLLGLTQTSTAADPTTTEYPADGDVGVHHNTSSGNRYFVWNDGGVIYKVQMT